MPCTPRMLGCSRACRHFQLVDDYRQERQRQEATAEAVSMGYDVEHKAELVKNPLITFQNWLVHSAVPPLAREGESAV
jgi:hypothetical protein